MNDSNPWSSLGVMNFQKWELFLAHPVYPSLLIITYNHSAQKNKKILKTFHRFVYQPNCDSLQKNVQASESLSRKHDIILFTKISDLSNDFIKTVLSKIKMNRWKKFHKQSHIILTP